MPKTNSMSDRRLTWRRRTNANVQSVPNMAKLPMAGQGDGGAGGCGGTEQPHPLKHSISPVTDHSPGPGTAGVRYSGGKSSGFQGSYSDWGSSNSSNVTKAVGSSAQAVCSIRMHAASDAVNKQSQRFRQVRPMTALYLEDRTAGRLLYLAS